MKKKHYIEAPTGSENLQNIEQLNDHSELSVMYPNKKVEWAGKELLSDSDRSKKRDAEYEQITTSAWRKFFKIGLLVPTPYVLLLALLYLSSLTVTIETIPKQIIPIFFAACLWGGLSFFAIKKISSLLYSHALQATPIYLTVLTFTALVILPIYKLATLVVKPPTVSSAAFDPPVIIIYLATAIGVYLACIVFSFIVLKTWTTPNLNNKARLAVLITVGLGLLALMVTTWLQG